MKIPVVVYWLRRDLRLQDHAGLFRAQQGDLPVLPIYIFNPEDLKQLPSRANRRLHYTWQALEEMQKQLRQSGKAIRVFYDEPLKVFTQLLQQYSIQGVYGSAEYEPKLIQRDRIWAEFIQTKGIAFHRIKEQVIFEPGEILKSDGQPYTVFTPYAKRWKMAVQSNSIQEYPVDIQRFLDLPDEPLPQFEQLGLDVTDIVFTTPTLDTDLMQRYAEQRDYPALDATSHLGLALQTGTISIRACVRAALQYSEVWLNQLIWREFFKQILYYFPQVERHCFKPAYERIAWRNNEQEFSAWCEGRTGYPLVDAGMRELNATGFMHNRVRMVTASFLCKHLLIDWRWGEAYFAEKLNDYDLASNNGNWQWAAGCGCDAAPYFRIFNPQAQADRFDKARKYIQRWNPDAAAVPPIVEHILARARALEVYKAALYE